VRPIGLAIALALLAVSAPGAASAALPIPPPPVRRVTDFAGALAPADRDRLEARLAEREKGSRNQVVVAIFRSLEGESLEDYSIRLAEQWKIGQRGLDNGVIFLIFLNDRKMRLEVGYGLEGTLTDAISSSILSQAVAPHFREGKVAEGIAAGLDAIDAAIKGEYRADTRRSARDDDSVPVAIPLAFTLLVILGIIISAQRNAMRARRNGWTGGSHGWGGGPFLGGGGFGGFGGGGSGGSSGGGFSGGGGSFGGGGSSGSW
jgi:uncharacterized protein